MNEHSLFYMSLLYYPFAICVQILLLYIKVHVPLKLEDWNNAFDNGEFVGSMLIALRKAFDCLISQIITEQAAWI